MKLRNFFSYIRQKVFKKDHSKQWNNNEPKDPPYQDINKNQTKDYTPQIAKETPA